MLPLTENYFRYIPVRQRDIQWGLYVTGAGCTAVPSGTRYPPAVHPRLYDFTWEKGRVLPEYQIIYPGRTAGSMLKRDRQRRSDVHRVSQNGSQLSQLRIAFAAHLRHSLMIVEVD